MEKSLKDRISNIVAVVATVAGIVQIVVGVWQQYVAANPDAAIDWGQLAILFGGAIIAYLTGKAGNLKGSA